MCVLIPFYAFRSSTKYCHLYFLNFFQKKSTTSKCNYINYIKLILFFFFLVGLVEFISLRSIWACALCLLSSFYFTPFRLNKGNDRNTEKRGHGIHFFKKCSSTERNKSDSIVFQFRIVPPFEVSMFEWPPHSSHGTMSPYGSDIVKVYNSRLETKIIMGTFRNGSKRLGGLL